MDHPAHLLKQLQGRARKRFGQHFLSSVGILDRIVAVSDVGPGSQVLEIGPGLGALTDRLLAAGASVTAVELDRDLAAFLRERLGDHERFRLIEADAARVDWTEVLVDGPWSCVANLPYNVGTSLTTELLRHPDRLSHLVLMLQKEVAARMVAPAGARNRGSLSVYCEARAAGRMAIKVPPGAFHPPPKVHSAVIRLDLYDAPRLDGCEEAHFEAVVRQAFAAPRKTLRKGLRAGWATAAVDGALATAGVEPRARPAVLSLEDWQRLAAALPRQTG